MAEYSQRDGGQEDKTQQLGKHSFIELMHTDNIVTLLDEEELTYISGLVLDEYQLDYDSGKDWRDRAKAGIDLAMMLAGEKNHPFRGASNVKYPLVARAALEFNARAYPAMVAPDRVVKCKTYGKDEDGAKAARGERVSEHMSWQLTAEDPNWEDDTDLLTLVVSIVGATYRKRYYDPALKRSVSRLILADRLVYNYRARSFSDLPRVTEILDLYPNEVRERENSKRFAAYDYEALAKGATDGPKSQDNAEQDTAGPMRFLEQHRLLDLDGDDYGEPYVVTVHKASGKVCRIHANWTAEDTVVESAGDSVKVISLRPQRYYTRYEFLKNPDGGAYGLGFGWLLADTNESINSTLNMLFDAGGLANMQGGFISAGLGLRDKTLRFERGEWKVLPVGGNLAQSVLPIKYDGPSAVLFSLLEFLVNGGKELASIKDVLTGETPATAPVGTTLALIEQGLQVFTSIYKRLHRSLKDELRQLQKLNEQYLDPAEYAAFCDDAGADPKLDYASKDMDILPVSDPQSVTKAQKIAKAQAVYGLTQQPPQNPVLNPVEATKRMLEALDVEDADELIVPPPPPDPEQDALMKRAAEAEVAGKEADAEQKTAAATKSLTDATKTLAETQAISANEAMGAMNLLMTWLKTEHGMEMDVAGQQQAALAGAAGVPGVAGQPGDPMGAGAAPAAGDGTGAGPEGQPLQQPAPQPGGLDGGAAQPSVPEGAL